MRLSRAHLISQLAILVGMEVGCTLHSASKVTISNSDLARTSSVQIQSDNAVLRTPSRIEGHGIEGQSTELASTPELSTTGLSAEELGANDRSTYDPQATRPINFEELAGDATTAQSLAYFDVENSATTSNSDPSAPAQTLSQSPAPTPLQPETRPSLIQRQVLQLDLKSALARVQGESPRVAFAHAQINQAYAQHEQAATLWLPHLRVGMNYNKHEGRIQDVVGTNIDTSRGAAFAGFGANAVGAGSPAVPGVSMQFHTSDAIFQRQITAFAWQARESQASAVVNDQLLETALAYLSLLESHQRRAIALESLKNGEQLVTLTTRFAQAGAGSEADVDRATAARALLETEAVRAEEASEVAAAKLAQLIGIDPQCLIEPTETQIVPIDLVDVDQVDLSILVATGLGNRPELSAHRSLVCEAVNRLRREENAPWLPSVLLGVSYGGFGAGTGSRITNGADRFDFDAAAWWEVRNLGFGERASRNQARSQIDQARSKEMETLDLVAREIVEARSQVLARHRQMSIAQTGITAAQKSYERNVSRIREAQGLPIEVLQSIQALDAARREYLRTVVDYNTAQFRLHRALGWPID